jgi:hypothetical protein
VNQCTASRCRSTADWAWPELGERDAVHPVLGDRGEVVAAHRVDDEGPLVEQVRREAVVDLAAHAGLEVVRPRAPLRTAAEVAGLLDQGDAVDRVGLLPQGVRRGQAEPVDQQVGELRAVEVLAAGRRGAHRHRVAEEHHALDVGDVLVVGALAVAADDRVELLVVDHRGVVVDELLGQARRRPRAGRRSGRSSGRSVGSLVGSSVGSLVGPAVVSSGAVVEVSSGSSGRLGGAAGALRAGAGGRRIVLIGGPGRARAGVAGRVGARLVVVRCPRSGRRRRR